MSSLIHGVDTLVALVLLIAGRLALVLLTLFLRQRLESKATYTAGRLL